LREIINKHMAKSAGKSDWEGVGKGFGGSHLSKDKNSCVPYNTYFTFSN
jgi:hypothetical protein